jgi:cytosine/adenosine deaminase-related metal-dependent hydrolase
MTPAEGHTGNGTSQGLLLANAHVVTGAGLPVIADGAVAIESNRIVQTGTTASLKQKFPHFKFIDLQGSVVMPGLFNSHTHVAMGFFRGLGFGKKDMIETFLFPAEKSLTPELVEPLSYSYILDGVRSGVTSFVDHYYFSAGVALAFETFGVRAWVGETIADLGGAFPGKQSFTRAKELLANSSFSSRINHVIAPHAGDTISKELLTEVANFAKSENLPLHMHLSQTPGELTRVQLREKSTPVQFAAACGAMTEKSLLVHLTSANASDIRIIKDHGSTIGWCPSSTIFYDRLAAIDEFFSNNIPLALGTDCPASSDHADILSEIRTASIFARDRKVDHKKIGPHELLSMATLNPAKMLGVDACLGTLEAGKLADIVVLDVSLSALPMADPLVNVIYSMGSRDVMHVMVDGNWVLWNKQLTSTSEMNLKSKYIAAVAEINSRVKRTKS